jgi:nicotinamide-nucleotide amidase
MADSVRFLADADYGVSITGYAGPGNTEEVGLIYIGVSSKKETRAVKLLTGHKGTSCRDYNRLVASSRAFNELRLTILSE